MKKAEMKKMMDKANPIFEKIKEELLPKYKGKMVVIEVDSGDYFVGDDDIDSLNRAKKKYPDKIFVFKGLGFETFCRNEIIWRL